MSVVVVVVVLHVLNRMHKLRLKVTYHMQQNKMFDLLSLSVVEQPLK